MKFSILQKKKFLVSIFKNINSLEKNVEKCTITVKYIPLNSGSGENGASEHDTTMVTKMIAKNNQEQLFDTKFLIIMNCKYGIVHGIYQLKAKSELIRVYT